MVNQDKRRAMMVDLRHMEETFDSGDHENHTVRTYLIEPALKWAKRYRRTTGEYSDSSLRSYANDMERIIRENVKIEILTHIRVNERTLKELERSQDEEEKRRILTENSNDVLYKAARFRDKSYDLNIRGDLLAWLIANEQLVIKFAFLRSLDYSNPNSLRSQFHNKRGYFILENEAEIAFTGSFNETRTGHEFNIEDTDIFVSWRQEDHKRLNINKNKIDKMWDEGNHAFWVEPVSDETLRLIRSIAPRERPTFTHPEEPVTPEPTQIFELPQEPTETEGDEDKPLIQIEFTEDIWEHKKEAIRKFLEVKKGILEMATGTGKTSTALEAARILYSQNKIKSVIIVVFRDSLQDQWAEEIFEWRRTFDTNNATRFYQQRAGHRDLQRFIMNPDDSILLIRRYAQDLEALFNALNNDNKAQQCMVIHDEVHGFGSTTNVNNLGGTHRNLPYALGLSATPMREYDEKGNDFILQEVGDVFFEYPLEKAINDGILAPFNYHPIKFNFTQRDHSRRQGVYAAQQRRREEGNPMSDEELARNLALIRKKAEEKPRVLLDYLSNHDDPLSLVKSSIIFCEDTSQAEEITTNVIWDFTQRFATFFQAAPDTTLDSFRQGGLDALVAVERLKEGIDIPSLNNVFLIASDRGKLEVIQRIGGCLRVDEENPNKVANIVDLVLDCEDQDEDGLSYAQQTDKKRMDWLNGLSQIRPED